MFTANGVLRHDLQLHVPGDKVKLHVIQTPSGYVIRDRLSKKVFFTDASGAILHTSTDCEDPWHGVHTSWGHVLIADNVGHAITVFSETGDFLGNVRDSGGNISRPHYLHLDESERLMYVGCGGVGSMQVRTYKFAPGDLPPLPLKLTERKLEMSVKLATVSLDR